METLGRNFVPILAWARKKPDKLKRDRKDTKRSLKVPPGSLFQPKPSMWHNTPFWPPSWICTQDSCMHKKLLNSDWNFRGIETSAWTAKVSSFSSIGAHFHVDHFSTALMSDMGKEGFWNSHVTRTQTVRFPIENRYWLYYARLIPFKPQLLFFFSD